MESLSPTMAPLLLRNLLASIFIYTHKSLNYFSEKNESLQFLRCFLTSAFLFFLRLLPSLFPSLDSLNYPPVSKNYGSYPVGGLGGGNSGESGIARALSQLLLIMNDIPVSSRKYDVVRSLIENLINENLVEGSAVLREVNCGVLTAAFGRSLSRLEVAVDRRRRRIGGGGDFDVGGGGGVVKGLVRGIWRYARAGEETAEEEVSAEKLAAEVLWLARMMVACGCGEVAVGKWAAAGNLGWVALGAEPRVQGGLVKVSAFLIKQAKEMGKQDFGEEADNNTIRQVKMKLLMSWLPLLCRASNGTDMPVLNATERAEVERIVEEIIWTLEEEEQERVLSLWLDHFAYCSVTDWPNLGTCYTRWFASSRRKLLLSAADATDNCKKSVVRF